MSIRAARRWIILASLIITGAQLVFFIVAPALDFPLEYPRNIALIQIISPVFFGYLGSASHFIFQSSPPNVTANEEYLGLLIKGPLLIYVLVVIAALVAFGYSNRSGAAIGSGMSLDALANSLTIALSVLAVTTGIITSYLFVTPNKGKISGTSDNNS